MSRSLEKILWQRAIELVEAGWTQFTDARGRTGRVVSPLSKRAVSFCAYGAFVRAASEVMPGGTLDELREFADKIIDDHELVMADNDFGTRREALALMRRRMRRA